LKKRTKKLLSVLGRVDAHRLLPGLRLTDESFLLLFFKKEESFFHRNINHGRH
jgi:hypothetical protein